MAEVCKAFLRLGLFRAAIDIRPRGQRRGSQFLNRRRRRASSLCWTDRTAAPILVKALAGLCVVLALIRLGLAMAYRDKARQVSC